MSTLFDRPARLSVRCDHRLAELLGAVTKARRQPPGGVLEDLVEAEYRRLVAQGRIAAQPGDADGAVAAAVGRHPASGRGR